MSSLYQIGRRSALAFALLALLAQGAPAGASARTSGRAAATRKLVLAGSKKPSAARVRDARSTSEVDQLGKILAGAKRYLPGKSALSREQLLAELLEQHPTELAEVAGFSGLSVDDLKQFIRSGAWEGKKPWGVALVDKAGKPLSGPWMIRRYLSQREGGATHEEALDYLGRHYDVGAAELARYFSLRGGWAKSALSKSKKVPDLVIPASQVDWAMPLSLADGRSVEGHELLALYAQGAKMTLDEARLALAGAPARPDVVRAIAKYRDLDEATVTRYFAAGTWGELPLALSSFGLQRGDEHLAPALVLDTYAQALPAARRVKGLSIVYDTLSGQPSTRVWDGDAIHAAANQLGVKEKDLFDYLKSGRWSRRRSKPQVVAASWNMAHSALTFSPEERKAAEVLVDAARNVSGTKAGRPIDGLRLGTKPFVQGKIVIPPEHVLKVLKEQDGPGVVQGALAHFGHGAATVVGAPEPTRDVIDRTAGALNVDREALADYLVYTGWAEKAGTPDRASVVKKLEAQLAMDDELTKVGQFSVGPRQLAERAFASYAKKTNQPVSLQKLLLLRTHDPAIRKQVAAELGIDDNHLFSYIHNGLWGRAAYALGTKPFVHGVSRFAPERVIGELVKAAEHLGQKRALVDALNTNANAAFDTNQPVAALPDAIVGAAEQALGLPHGALRAYLQGNEWTKFDHTLSSDGKRSTEPPELAQLMRVYLHEGEERAGSLGRTLMASMQRGKQVNRVQVDTKFQELLVQSRFELGRPEPDAVLHVSFDQLLTRVASLPVAQLGRTVVVPPAAKRSDGTALSDLELMEELKDAKEGFRHVFNVVRQNAERKKAGLPEIPLQLHAVYEGNRGTGKTSVAKLYARMLKELGLVQDEKIVEIRIADVARKAGQNVDNIKKELEAHKGKVVVVEGLEALKNDPSAAMNMMDYQSAKMVAEQLQIMANAKDLVVVLSGDQNEVKAAMSQEAVKRLAPTKIGFPDYKNQTLARILDKMAYDQKYELDEKTVTQVSKMIGASRGPDFTNAIAVADALKAAIGRQSSRLVKAGTASDPKEMRRLSMRDFIPEKPSATGPDSAFAKLEGMIGLDKVKEQFRALDNLMKYNERLTREGKQPTVPLLNAMFTGNPGTGKTTVARLYGRFLSERGFLSNGGIVEVTAKDLLGKTVGEAATLVKAAVASAKGKVLFIDEAYALFDKSGVGYGKDALDTLVGLINPESNQDIAIVMAGYKGEMEEMIAKSNPGLRRRMGRNFEFEDYTIEQLGKILDGKAKEKSVKLGAEARTSALNELARLKRVPQFGNGGTVNNMIDQAIVRMADRLATQKSTKGGKKAVAGELVAEDLVPRPSKPGSTMKDLEKMTGLESVKKAFHDLDALVAHNLEREKAGLPPEVPNLNAVFTGNPGTGKTTVARMYGKFLKEKGFLSDGELIEVKPQDIIGGVIGETEKKVKELIERAQGKVLFIDEAYQLHASSKNGGGNANVYGSQAIDALVAAINADGNQNFAVVLAGYKNEMEDMMRNSNPGLSRRFRQKFEFEDYKNDDLAKIMEKKARDKGYTLSKDALHAAVEQLGRERAMPNFGNAGAVENMINTALQRQAGRLRGRVGLTREELTALTVEDLVADKAPKPAEAAHVLADLVGQEHVKTKITEYEAIIADAKARGADPAKYFEPYFLFTGSPGTGKTTVAKKMGKIFHKLGFLASDEVVVKDAADLVAKYEGQTADKVDDIFRSAMGKTLFIDEAYKLADRNSPFAKQAIERMLTLLTENRGKIAVILAGYGENMEVLMNVNPGLKSRFSEQLKFQDLTNPMARDAFKRLLNEEKFTLSADAEHALEAVFARLMKAPAWSNYRDIETLFYRTQRKRSVRMMSEPHANRMEVTKADVEAALEEFLDTKASEHGHVQATQHLDLSHDLGHAQVQRANAHHEAPQHAHGQAHGVEHAMKMAHDHGGNDHGHTHDHDNVITKLYSAEQQAALNALQHVVDSEGLDAATVNDMEAGKIPPKALAAMMAKMHVSEQQAKAAIKAAFEAMKMAELALQQMAKPQPPRTRVEKTRVCLACGRSTCNFRAVWQSYAVNDDTGERTPLESGRLPGVGW